MRWPLSALLLAMAIAGCVFGVFTAFWDASHPNHTVLLGAFILLICVNAVGAVFGAGLLRWLARNTKLGFALFAISFLASKLSQMVTWPVSNSQSTRLVDEQSHALEAAVGPVSNGESSPPAQ